MMRLVAEKAVEGAVLKYGRESIRSSGESEVWGGFLRFK